MGVMIIDDERRVQSVVFSSFFLTSLCIRSALRHMRTPPPDGAPHHIEPNRIGASHRLNPPSTAHRTVSPIPPLFVLLSWFSPPVLAFKFWCRVHCFRARADWSHVRTDVGARRGNEPGSIGTTEGARRSARGMLVWV